MNIIYSRIYLFVSIILIGFATYVAYKNASYKYNQKSQYYEVAQLSWESSSCLNSSGEINKNENSCYHLDDFKPSLATAYFEITIYSFLMGGNSYTPTEMVFMGL